MKKIILALAASAAAMGAAHAQGPYVGLGIVNADTELHMPGAASTSGGGWKSSGKLFAGYEFDETFGAEMGYTDFRGGDFTYLVASVPGRVEVDGRATHSVSGVQRPFRLPLLPTGLPSLWG
jgi:OOP family OmpA-OmpF porin